MVQERRLYIILNIALIILIYHDHETIMTMTMKLKATSVYAYAYMRIYYISIVVNLLHVLITFCGCRQGSDFTKDMLQRQPNHCINIKY